VRSLGSLGKSDEARSITAATAADGLYEQLSSVFVEVIRMEPAIAVFDRPHR
jgi:hypothetical protein